MSSAVAGTLIIPVIEQNRAEPSTNTAPGESPRSVRLEPDLRQEDIAPRDITGTRKPLP